MRTDRSITHSDAGGLSTVMKFDESSEPNRNAVQLLLPACAGSRVELVGPARLGQADQVEQRGADQQPGERDPLPAPPAAE